MLNLKYADPRASIQHAANVCNVAIFYNAFQTGVQEKIIALTRLPMRNFTLAL